MKEVLSDAVDEYKVDVGLEPSEVELEEEEFDEDDDEEEEEVEFVGCWKGRSRPMMS